jgi:hypothetical protein
MEAIKEIREQYSKSYDVGKVRDQRSKSYGVGKICAVVAGAGAGALLMYLFDPDRGRGRRAKLRDQVTRQANQLGSAAGSKARDLRNRARGVIHEVSSVIPGQKKSSDVPAIGLKG